MTDKVVGIYGEVGIANMKKTLAELKTLRRDLTKTQRQLDSLKAQQMKQRAQSNSEIARIRKKTAAERQAFNLRRAETAFQRKRLQLLDDEANKASIDKRFAQAKKAYREGGSKTEFDDRMFRIRRDMDDMLRIRSAKEAEIRKEANALIANQTKAAKIRAAEEIRAARVAERIRSRRRSTAEVGKTRFMEYKARAGLGMHEGGQPQVYSAFAKEFARLNFEMKSGLISTGAYNVKLAGLTRRMNQAGKSTLTLSQRLGGLRRMMIAATGAYTAFGAVMAIERTGMAFEGGGIMMEAVLGADAPEMMKFLRAEARRLGIDLARSQKSFSKFIASTKGLNYTNDQLKEMYSSISEAAVVFNLSQDNVDGLMKAFEQMAGKGQVMAEELKNQIGDRLFGSLERAAKAAGMTRKEFIKAMELGQVDVQDFLPEFLRILREEAAPGLTKALETTKVAKDRMANDFEDLKNTIFVNGLGDALTATYNFIGDFMAAMKPFAAFFTGFFTGLYESVIWVFQGIAAIFGDLSDALGPELIEVLGDIGRILGYVAGFLLTGPIMVAFKLLGAVLRPIAGILEVITKASINFLRATGILKSTPLAANAGGNASKFMDPLKSAMSKVTTEGMIKTGAVANMAGTAYRNSSYEFSLTPETARALKINPRRNMAQELDRGTK